jgi:hypothetical protein
MCSRNGQELAQCLWCSKFCFLKESWVLDEYCLLKLASFWMALQNFVCCQPLDGLLDLQLQFCLLSILKPVKNDRMYFTP